MDRLEKNGHWVAVLSAAEVQLAAPLRHSFGLEALPAGDCVWVRGPLRHDLTSGNLEQQLLRLLPGIRPYLMGEDGQLTRVGDRVPTDRIPIGTWRSLDDWLRLDLPPIRATFPGSVSTIPVSLVRSAEECEPSMLLTSTSAWAEYAATAPQWRLERLVFAINESQRVLIRGTPLPPIPGQRWVERNGVATAAGWTWKPAVEPAVLRSLLEPQLSRTGTLPVGKEETGKVPVLRSHSSIKLELQPDDLLLLEETQLQVVYAADWVRATRSAVRASSEVAHEQS
jgi:hypothetical protein